MNRMVVFNVAWMNKYEGVNPQDMPVGGGTYIGQNGYGSEVYNFLPYGEKILGFVEAGWKPTPRCINITKLGASKTAQSVSSVTVVWVARHISKPQTVVVGWYKNANVFKARQIAPLNPNRMLPNGAVAEYFVEADKCDCDRVPPDSRNIAVPRGLKGGLGQKNIWYLSGNLGQGCETRLIAYIATNHNSFVV